MIDFFKKISQLTVDDVLNSAGVIFIVLFYAISVIHFSINEIFYLLVTLTLVGLGLNAILYSHKTTNTTPLLHKSF